MARHCRGGLVAGGFTAQEVVTVACPAAWPPGSSTAPALASATVNPVASAILIAPLNTAFPVPVGSDQGIHAGQRPA